MSNAVEELFKTYKEQFRGTYLTQDEFDKERQAFTNGILACLAMLGLDPDHVTHPETGRSIMFDAMDALKECRTVQ